MKLSYQLKDVFLLIQQIGYFSPQISGNFDGITGNWRELPEHPEFCRKVEKF